MEIKEVSIDKLKPFAGNPKKHPKEQIELLGKSLKTYGQTKSVIVDKEYMILAGHGLVEAAKKNGMKEIRVGIVPFSGKKALAYILADNKLAEFAEWDFTKLTDLISELDDGEFDLEITGFNKEEIEELLTAAPISIEEEKPEIEFTEELLEEHNYIVLYFDNEIDWLQAQTLFDLKTVQSKHSMEQKGVGRVIGGAKAIQKIREELRDGN